jgi:hypothetical protein
MLTPAVLIWQQLAGQDTVVDVPAVSLPAPRESAAIPASVAVKPVDDGVSVTHGQPSAPSTAASPPTTDEPDPRRSELTAIVASSAPVVAPQAASVPSRQEEAAPLPVDLPAAAPLRGREAVTSPSEAAKVAQAAVPVATVILAPAPLPPERPSIWQGVREQDVARAAPIPMRSVPEPSAGQPPPGAPSRKPSRPAAVSIHSYSAIGSPLMSSRAPTAIRTQSQLVHAASTPAATPSPAKPLSVPVKRRAKSGTTKVPADPVRVAFKPPPKPAPPPAEARKRVTKHVAKAEASDDDETPAPVVRRRAPRQRDRLDHQQDHSHRPTKSIIETYLESLFND